jgi:uncharacterized protein YkwD
MAMRALRKTDVLVALAALMAATCADPGGSPPASSATDASPGSSLPPPTSAPPAMTGEGADGCAVTRPGATGKEADGLIPVCCLPTADEKTAIDEVFRLLNQHRADNGRAPLSYDPALASAIQGHCRHMAAHDFFDHTAPEPVVAQFTTRAKLCGASAFGENIAYNQATPAAVMQSWTDSAGHNQNMLNPDYTRVGICYSARRWGQIFGR